LLISLCLLSAAAFAEDKKERLANTVILDESGVKNLGIETIEAEETTFEETVFALGRIEVLPGKKAIVSSRVPGRAFSVLALPDQTVDEGEELMWVESRQPGDPPPTIMLPAPMAGLIAKVDIAVGQPITPDQSLIEIVDLSTVEASARVPEHLAAKLKKGQKAHIRVPGFPDQVFEAELAHIGAYADAESGTIEAAFHVPNKELLLRPEMRAEFNIVVSSREGVMAIPRAAVQGDVAGRFVYIKDYELENAFVKVPLVLGTARNPTVSPEGSTDKIGLYLWRNLPGTRQRRGAGAAFLQYRNDVPASGRDLAHGRTRRSRGRADGSGGMAYDRKARCARQHQHRRATGKMPRTEPG
jgi:multidrug efflux pump subunit AcrA (membrane-fusion protein)